MSRFYGMHVSIDNVHPHRVSQVIEAAGQEWEFNDWSRWESNNQFHLESYGESYLCGGESEEEFTDRLAAAVWKANGQFCEVRVDATYLEELPYETHERDVDDYQRWMAHA